MRNLNASDLMVTPVVCARGNTSLKEIMNLFAEAQYHGIPVVDEDRMVIGIITERDVLKALAKDKGIDGFVARDIMSRDVVTAEKGANFSAVIKAMVEKSVGRLVITDHNKLLGIVTKRDIIRKMVTVPGFLSV